MSNGQKQFWRSANDLQGRQKLRRSSNLQVYSPLETLESSSPQLKQITSKVWRVYIHANEFWEQKRKWSICEMNWIQAKSDKRRTNNSQKDFKNRYQQNCHIFWSPWTILGQNFWDTLQPFWTHFTQLWPNCDPAKLS